MHEYIKACQIVEKPEEKVSKYEVAAKMLMMTAENQALRIDRVGFNVGGSNRQVKDFISNLRYYLRREHKQEIDGKAQNGHILIWKKTEPQI